MDWSRQAAMGCVGLMGYRICRHPNHNQPEFVMLKPGTYEHLCPGCGKKSVIRARGEPWSGNGSKRWEASV